MIIQVSPKEAINAITTCIRAKLPVFITSSPGCGKSSIVRGIADQHRLKVIDLRLAQCDPTDLLGFPNIVGDRADYLPMVHFPLEGDEVPEGFDGWLLFLDEFNHAPPAIQSAAYKLVLDRMVGSRKLHSRVAIVLAGNKDSDNALVQSLSTAMQSRLIHLELRLDHEEWIEWGSKNGIHHFITDYIGFAPDKLFTFRPDHSDNTYACPRTWEFADRLIKTVGDIRDPLLMPLLAGTISEGVAREFLVYTKIYDRIPKPAEIYQNPESVPVPDEPSMLFALCGTLSNNAKADTFDAAMKYIRRFPAEFQIVVLKDTVRRQPDLMQHPSVTKWAEESDTVLY